MAETIAELQERKKTDRRLSFGLYLVFLLVVIILGIIIGVIGRWIGGFGAGRIVSMIVYGLGQGRIDPWQGLQNLF